MINAGIKFMAPLFLAMFRCTEDCALQSGAGQMFNQPITGPIPGVSWWPRRAPLPLCR